MKDDSGKSSTSKRSSKQPQDMKRAPTPKNAGRAVNAPADARAISGEERTRLIAEAAYYRAQARGFAAGSEEQDWLAAEAEVNAKLMAAQRNLHN